MSWLASILLGCVALQEPAALPTLVVGSPAPPFVVERFLRGAPRARLEPGRVYLIEFWTAWCGPCVAGMPHLAALERELGPRGLTVIGVAPRPDEWGHDLAAIEALAARAPDAYALALDAESDSPEGYQGVFHGQMIESWMGAARVGAVPVGFVIDREGFVAGIAPPLELEGVVRACLDGSFERDRAAREYRALLAARALLVEFEGLLARRERELARALAEELLTGPLWNDARYLGVIADALGGQEADGEELALALRAARRANELSGAHEPGTLGLLARLCLRDGARAEAERWQERALELAEGEFEAALVREYEAEATRSWPNRALEQRAAGEFLALFEGAPLVALAEHHRRREVHEFLLALVDHPRFGAVVDDIVVEFGNAHFQALMDRYVAGQEVAPEDLRRAWRDTGQWLVWDSPLYARFFERVRAANLARPPEERVRVLLGDPPLDWATVTDAQGYRAFAERDEHFAALVEREVLARDRRALLVTGSAHLELRGPLDGPARAPSAGALIAQRNPGALAVVWSLPADAELARKLGFGTAPALRALRDDALARESFALVAARGILVRVAGEWKPAGELRWPPLSEMAAALLFVGDQNTQVDPDPALYREPLYQTELRRRAAILTEVYGLEFLPELEALLATPGSAR